MKSFPPQGKGLGPQLLLSAPHVGSQSTCKLAHTGVTLDFLLIYLLSNFSNFSMCLFFFFFNFMLWGEIGLVLLKTLLITRGPLVVNLSTLLCKSW